MTQSFPPQSPPAPAAPSGPEGTQGPQGHMASNSLINDATLETFGPLVMEASNHAPVLVDFWADWCSPCKQMMPVIEKLVTEKAGAVTLVKVNADENQALCGQLRIQSLPTVMAFYQGQPVDGFQGALPESQLRQFIDGVIEKSGAPAGAGAGNDQAAQIKQALEQIQTILDAGGTDNANQALDMLGQVLAVDPDNTAAKIMLAEAHMATGGRDQVPAIIATLSDEALKDDPALKTKVDALNSKLELLAATEGLDDKATLLKALEADKANHSARFDLAMVCLAEGDPNKAAEELLRICMVDMDWEDQKARKQLLKLFDAAGPTDPFSLKYRRRLSSLIFS